MSARELRRERSDLFSFRSLLLGTRLSELDLHGLYRRRLRLQLLCSAELAQQAQLNLVKVVLDGQSLLSLERDHGVHQFVRGTGSKLAPFPATALLEQ